MGDFKHTTLLALLVVLAAVASVHCQYQDDFGPAPPRLLIPGAVSLGPAPRRQGPRSQQQSRRPQQLDSEPGPGPAPRLRSRPTARRLPVAPPPPPQPAPQFFAPAPVLHQQRQLSEDFIPVRPVIEDNDDEYEDDLPPFSPSPSPSTPPPPPPPPPQRPSTFRPAAFRPERPVLLPTPTPELNFVSPSRQQLRPAPQRLPDQEEEEEELSRRPAFTARHKARPTAAPADEPQQYSRQPPTRAQAVVRAPQKSSFSSGKQDEYEKPLRDHQRQRKPVAQVLRRYREDNPDGSITWGFENDDGSFKEETIGTDCVTYGKYGYIDPDGTRREYTYSTGIPCDKSKDSETQSSEGYIDYAENKYILPNGDSIDLDKMVKNRARRPVAKQQYRN